MVIPVILLLGGSSPFALPRKRAPWANGCTQIYVLSPQHVRFARACFGIRDFTMIFGGT